MGQPLTGQAFQSAFVVREKSERISMLQCNMTMPLDIQLELEDLLGDLHFARRADQLGRLALLAYCDCKSWARRAGKWEIAEKALDMFTENPCLSKKDFLERIDHLIAVLERHQTEYQREVGSFSMCAVPAIYPAAHQ